MKPAVATAFTARAQEISWCTHLTGRPIHAIHILGGSARNTLVNQWLADAMNVPVLAGPTEAMALGNVLMQLVGLRELASLTDVRAVAM